MERVEMAFVFLMEGKYEHCLSWLKWNDLIGLHLMGKHGDFISLRRFDIHCLFANWLFLLFIFVTVIFLCQVPEPLNIPSHLSLPLILWLYNLTWHICLLIRSQHRVVWSSVRSEYRLPLSSTHPSCSSHFSSSTSALDRLIYPPPCLDSPLLPLPLPVLSAWQRKWKGAPICRPIRWVNTHSPSLR